MIGPGATVDKNGNVKATLKKVEGFTDFSSVEEEQSGHYFPFSLTVTGSKMTFKKNETETKKDIPFDKDIIFRTEKPCFCRQIIKVSIKTIIENLYRSQSPLGFFD